MENRLQGTRYVTYLLALVLLIPTWVSGKPPTRDLIIFGDSLSDAGNYFTVLGETVQAPYEPIPVAPYTIGGHHFSNGRTWVEQLARTLHVPTSSGPALAVNSVFTNYAFGRARARMNAPVFPMYDLTQQVSQFMADFGNIAPSSATYIVFIGSNDVRDALDALAMVPPDPALAAEIITAAILATSDNILVLWTGGARDFLVSNIPNLANVPAVRAQGPLAQIVAEQLTNDYNAALSMALDGLSSVLPGIKFYRLDTFTLLDDVVENPGDSGLKNVVDSCLSFGVTGGALCAQPNRFLFWDGAHPTEAGHRLLSEAAADLLTARE